MPLSIKNELAIWKRTKLPANHVDTIQWSHECAPITHSHPPLDSGKDYSPILTTVQSWLDTNSQAHLSHKQNQHSTPPKWLTEKLLRGGMSKADASTTVVQINNEFRLLCTENWKAQNPTNIQERKEKPLFDLEPTRKVKHWGAATPGSRNVAIRNTPNTPPATPNSVATLATIRLTHKRGPLDLTEPKRYNYQKYDLPAESGVKIKERLRREKEAYILATQYRQAVATYTPEEALCGRCMTTPGAKLWHKPDPVLLCAPCRTQLERRDNHPIHPDATNCHKCGSFDIRGEEWTTHLTKNGALHAPPNT